MSKATIFMGAGWIGVVSMAISLAAITAPIPESVGVIAGIICILCCWVLLSTRNADEYTQGLWASAASLAFAALLVMMIGWPFLEGVYAGFTGIEDGEPSLEGIIGCAIAAFYTGLVWKRLRGGM